MKEIKGSEYCKYLLADIMFNLRIYIENMSTLTTSNGDINFSVLFRVFFFFLFESSDRVPKCLLGT